MDIDKGPIVLGAGSAFPTFDTARLMQQWEKVMMKVPVPLVVREHVKMLADSGKFGSNKPPTIMWPAGPIPPATFIRFQYGLHGKSARKRKWSQKQVSFKRHRVGVWQIVFDIEYPNPLLEQELG